jgi:hypothetical protein
MRRSLLLSAPLFFFSATIANAQTPPLAATPSAARVHITSPRPVVLFRKPANDSAGWTRVCESPCDLDLPIGDTYRIAGPGVSESNEISLAGGSNGAATELTVDPSNKTGIIVGATVGGVGGLSLLAGAFYFAFGTITKTGKDCSEYPERPILFGTSRAECVKQNETSDTLQTIGLVMMGIGAVVGIAGLFIFWRSAKTEMKQHAQPAAPAPPVAVKRWPSWRGAVNEPSGAPAATFPILFTHSF